MKNKVLEKYEKLSLAILCANVIFSIIAVVTALKLISNSAFLYAQDILWTKLLFTDVFVTVLLGFSHFCGVIAAMSPIFCFAFSFFNAFAFFISIANCDIPSMSIVFATLPLCLSLLYFCFSAHAVSNSVITDRPGTTRAKKHLLYDLLRFFIFSMISLLLMLAVSLIIQ